MEKLEFYEDDVCNNINIKIYRIDIYKYIIWLWDMKELFGISINKNNIGIKYVLEVFKLNNLVYVFIINYYDILFEMVVLMINNKNMIGLNINCDELDDDNIE